MRARRDVWPRTTRPGDAIVMERCEGINCATWVHAIAHGLPRLAIRVLRVTPHGRNAARESPITLVHDVLHTEGDLWPTHVPCNGTHFRTFTFYYLSDLQKS